MQIVSRVSVLLLYQAAFKMISFGKEIDEAYYPYVHVQEADDAADKVSVECDLV